MFSDYQMQEMSENFIDSFGFQEDEFTESEENVRCGGAGCAVLCAVLLLNLVFHANLPQMLQTCRETHSRNILLLTPFQQGDEEAELGELPHADRRLHQAGHLRLRLRAEDQSVLQVISKGFLQRNIC